MARQLAEAPNSTNAGTIIDHFMADTNAVIEHVAGHRGDLMRDGQGGAGWRLGPADGLPRPQLEPAEQPEAEDRQGRKGVAAPPGAHSSSSRSSSRGASGGS